MRYRLVDHGFTAYKKIMCGRDWVGRVCRHQGGGYLGIIGKTTVRADTESEAFQEVAARAMGFANVSDLHESNAAIRRSNAARRGRARALADRYMAAKTFEERNDVFDEMFGIKK